MSIVGAPGIGDSVPNHCTRLLDLSASPERILRSLETGALATASVEQRRMAIHIATPEGQAWVQALRAVNTPSEAEATNRVGAALRGLALTAPDPVPPELALCASRHPTTGRFRTEPILAIGDEGSVSTRPLVDRPRYRPGLPGHLINIHTHPVLSNDGTKFVSSPISGLSPPDIHSHVQKQDRLGDQVSLTTASVCVLSGHTTSITGPEMKVSVWAPAILDTTTNVGSNGTFSGNIVEDMHAEGCSLGRPVIGPPGSQSKVYQASLEGYYEAERTPAAAALRYLENRDLMKPLVIS